MTHDPNPTLEELWKVQDFEPTDYQEEAIQRIGGPLYLTAGPGSGKTLVLLWRTLNLIVFHGIKPEEIFLSTFTEKAALQLREGLRGLLTIATKFNGKHYDISKMYVGTVHSLCQKLLTDRRFSPDHRRPSAPILKDELAQYLYIYQGRRWKDLCEAAGLHKNANMKINDFFNFRPSSSRHHAVSNCISLFNRLSEECIEPKEAKPKATNRTLRKLINLYAGYKASLLTANPRITDFSLLQQLALNKLEELDRDYNSSVSGQVFKHVIIDEYQDTNTVQERLFFKLSKEFKNLCVVGDDDQALYRFRGATVENFVEFPSRCRRYLGVVPTKIPLTENFRSRNKIIEFYKNFIGHKSCNWCKEGKKRIFYRVPKDITAHRQDDGPSVVVSTYDEPKEVCHEIAALVRCIIDMKKVEDPNEIAFLYPSLKSVQVRRMIKALESVGLRVYAPRAKTFLDVDEAILIFGLMLQIFGRPKRDDFGGSDYENFHNWLDKASAGARKVLQKDHGLAAFLIDKKEEINTTIQDYKILKKVADRYRWDLEAPYNIEIMSGPLEGANSLSKRAQKTLASAYVKRLIRERETEKRPYSLKYMINRATSLDWNILDLFYRFTFFKIFRDMFDAACYKDRDEGPIWNLSLISHYLSRFMDEYRINVLTGKFLSDNNFQRVFFSNYLYALYRRGESEYEDAEDPFPKGRIPFLTIHQSKGLEFPVVVLGNPGKIARLQRVEEIVHTLLDPKKEKEPKERMALFDVMRMFYVALSRAKNLLVIARYKSGHINEPFKDLIDKNFFLIHDLEVNTIPDPDQKSDDLPRNYSYTGDYLSYKRCPRQYMLFRKYNFAPSRTQTMFFGNLVHQTIEDLHQYLIAERSKIHG